MIFRGEIVNHLVNVVVVRGIVLIASTVRMTSSLENVTTVAHERKLRASFLHE